MNAKITDKIPSIKSLVERAAITDQWLLNRLENVLPVLMKKHGIDMWVTIGREYNEDPISSTFFPSAIDSSRRLTIFVFVMASETKNMNRFVLQGNKNFEPFYSCYPLKTGTSQFDGLREIMDTYNPQNIAINKSNHFAFCDGLSQSFYETLIDSIGKTHANKLISSERLTIDWLQTRTDDELTMYGDLVEITQIIVKKALSNEVIVPSITSTEEVVQWIRQYVLDLGIETSFYPTVDIQRKDASADRITGTILPGDIVHLDFGIKYLGLCTDTQQLAYVLHTYEKSAPKGLRNAFHSGIEFEDVFMTACKLGMTGNEVFSTIMKNARMKNLDAMLYSHPIGYHCHGAGPLIGLYDKQEEIPVRGDLQIQNNTCYALEFNVRVFIPEWNKSIPIYLEETICFSKNKMQSFHKMQSEFFLIHS
jgi:hypothetical protein